MAKKLSRTSRGARPSKAPGTALVPLPADARAALAVPADAIAVREDDTILIAGAPYFTHGRRIPDAQVYYVGGVKSRKPGAWLGEADKVAWRDRATGYECIIMRSEHGGHLCGYVGVPVGHPLHGFDDDAIPADLDLEVHGGITYAALCQHGPSPVRYISVEARRICHGPSVPPRIAPVVHASDYRVQDDDAWWFGFECNQVYDLVPDGGRDRRFLQDEIGRVYRDEGYVHDQVLNLAAQMKAIADGEPKPDMIGEAPPPIGLDPRSAR